MKPRPHSKIPRIAHKIEQYAKINAFVLKGKIIAPKSGRTGRPSVMTQETVRKLEYAFVYDSTVEEACLYAGISRETYYTFCKQHPDFADRVEQLRCAPYWVARQTLIAAAEHDPDLALKILERKRRQEFSTRTEVSQTSEVVNRHYVDPEQVALIKRAMGNWAIKKARDVQRATQ